MKEEAIRNLFRVLKRGKIRNGVASIRLNRPRGTQRCDGNCRALREETILQISSRIARHAYRKSRAMRLRNRARGFLFAYARGDSLGNTWTLSVCDAAYRVSRTGVWHGDAEYIRHVCGTRGTRAPVFADETSSPATSPILGFPLPTV